VVPVAKVHSSLTERSCCRMNPISDDEDESSMDQSEAPSMSTLGLGHSQQIEIGRTSKVKQLRDDAVTMLEDLLADKMEEVSILQEQLALLSKHHVRETHMVDPYGDSGIYTGQVNNEKPHGKGTSRFYCAFSYYCHYCVYFKTRVHHLTQILCPIARYHEIRRRPHLRRRMVRRPLARTGQSILFQRRRLRWSLPIRSAPWYRYLPLA
jgi:hypothetical protein